MQRKSRFIRNELVHFSWFSVKFINQKFPEKANDVVRHDAPFPNFSKNFVSESVKIIVIFNDLPYIDNNAQFS